MKFKKLIVEGEYIPIGYGIGWKDFSMNRTIIYPIPFNMIIRWLRDLLFWFMSAWRPGYKERIEGEAFVKGRNIGSDMWIDIINREKQEAYDDGYKDGQESGVELTFKMLEAQLKKKDEL